jgi:1-acyl-sn-glycerol-3-phosphate acyltransferase
MVYAISYHLCRWIARLFFGLQVEGLEHIPRTGAAILAPNHVSYLDPVVVGVSLPPRRIHFMAKGELFRGRLGGWFFRSLQAYPVDRERLDPSTLKRTLSLLEAGQIVLMFPEGTRGDGRALGPAKPGVAMIAARSRVPVVPVFHWGTERVLPRGSHRIRHAPLRVRFGPPLYFPGGVRAGRESVEVFGREIIEAISALRPPQEELAQVSG